ncbi:MAG: metal-sensing transcriptional repressor [Nocardioidaceae bacterium]
MIEDDRGCVDVVPQVAAAIRALQEVALGMVMTIFGIAPWHRIWTWLSEQRVSTRRLARSGNSSGVTKRPW